VIDLLPDEDQQNLVDAVVAFLSREMPIERLRPDPGSECLPSQHDGWSEFAQLGWLGLGLPESLGGSGYSIIELMLIFREFGRYLLPPELVSSVIAARALAGRSPEWARQLGAGSLRAGMAVPLGTDGWYHLIGPYDRTGLALNVLESKPLVHEIASFRDIKALNCIDSSVYLSQAVQSTGTPAQEVEAQFAAETRVLVCAMLAGIAEAARDLAVGYAKVREQFGQSIGSFQAVKHMCADMAVRAESAYCLTALAALSLAADEADADFQVSAAAAIAAAAAIDNAAQAIQIHGGIGFTLECDVHLFLKRAHVLDKLLGSAVSRRKAVLGARVRTSI
jgi:alkylation response protein AidB-like acyl-CoA dehydrogenase